MKDLNISVEEGVKEVVILYGAALTPKEPKQVAILGVLDSPLKWLEKRVKEVDQKSCHITLNRDTMTITLVIDEANHYATSIIGKMELHPAYVKLGINSGTYLTPFEMAELIKMNRSYFENRQYAMELVTQLRLFKAKIDKEVEAEINPNKGDRKILIAQKVDSNVPAEFNVVIPIFKGTDKKTITCETYFNPDDLTCTIVSPGANESVEDMRDCSIDNVITAIKAIAPDITIIEI